MPRPLLELPEESASALLEAEQEQSSFLLQEVLETALPSALVVQIETFTRRALASLAREVVAKWECGEGDPLHCLRDVLSANGMELVYARQEVLESR